MKKILLLMMLMVSFALNINAAVNYVCSPAAGSTVESLKKVVLTFPDYAVADVNSWLLADCIKNESGKSLGAGSLSYADAANAVTWEYGNYAITDAGTYTITIPAGAISLAESEEADMVATTEDITFTITVGAAEAPQLQMTYPQANTTVNELPDYVTFMFNQEVPQPYAAAIQNGYNDPVIIEPVNISVIDGNTVKLVLTDKVKEELGTLGADGVTVYVQLTETQQYDTHFTVAPEFAVASSTFDAKGGQVVFNDNCDFVDYATEGKCYVSAVKTKNIATQATLTLDDDNYDAVNVEFAEELTDGDYTLDIPEGLIMSKSEEPLASVKIPFTIEGGIAKFVGVSPVEGEEVNLDTEYIITFSKPVTFTSYLSDITIGENPFGSGDGATFTQNEDKTEIHVTLDKSILAMYGVYTLAQANAKWGASLTVNVYGVKDAETKEAVGDYAFTYQFGKPTITVELNGEYDEDNVIASLSTVYLSNPEGIEIADGTQEIKVVGAKTKNIVYSVAASELTYVGGEYGSAGCYILTLDETLTEPGSYKIQIPEGTFTLAGKSLNETQEVNFTIAAAPVFTSDPADGSTVAEFQNIVLTFPEVYTADYDWDHVMDAGYVMKDGMYVCGGTFSYSDTEDYELVMKQIVFQAAKPITEAGTYTITIPASYVMLDYQPTATDIVITLTVDPTTGISVAEVNSDAIMYNLNGQRINAAKGIVIKNGKKVVVK